MRPQAKKQILEDLDIVKIHIERENWRTAYKYARSLTRRLQADGGNRPFLIQFRNLAPGEFFTVPAEEVMTMRFYAWKAGKVLRGRKFSVKRSKLHPGKYICKREK